MVDFNSIKDNNIMFTFWYQTRLYTVRALNLLLIKLIHVISLPNGTCYTPVKLSYIPEVNMS